MLSAKPSYAKPNLGAVGVIGQLSCQTLSVENVSGSGCGQDSQLRHRPRVLGLAKNLRGRFAPRSLNRGKAGEQTGKGSSIALGGLTRGEVFERR